MKKGRHRTPNVERQRLNERNSGLWVLQESGAGRRTFNLEDRLLEFTSAVIDLSETLPETRAGNQVAGQILRSGTSPYPNHGEAESAESRDDFIHKLKICLKELRETRRWARLIQRKHWAENNSTLCFVLGESDELIRIFMSSTKTAQQNAPAQRRKPSVSSYPLGGAG